MGKGRRKEAARAAEAARVQAWKADNAPASDGRGLADDDLIKVAKKKIEANPERLVA